MSGFIFIFYFICKDWFTTMLLLKGNIFFRQYQYDGTYMNGCNMLRSKSALRDYLFQAETCIFSSENK